MAKRRATKRAKNFNKKKQSFATKVKKVLSSRIERKFAEIQSASLNPSSTVGVATANVTGIAQGDTDQTRDGNEIRLRSINLRYRIQQHASAPETYVRVVMIRMKGTVSDAAPDWNDIYLEDKIVSQKDHRLSERFTVLYDKVHAMSSAGRTAIFQKYYKSCDYKVKWNGAAAADHEHGSVFLYFMSNETTNTPSVTYSTQVSFEDA